MSTLKRIADPFMVGIIVMMVLGLVLPIPTEAIGAIRAVSNGAIFVLFLLYGARLSTREVVDGMKNVRLQGAIIASTFVLFPILGLITQSLSTPFLGETLAAGLLYVALLPSTVQSSVAFVSVARGNIAGAITAATVSNLIGMIATPLLVLWLMGASGSMGWANIRDILLLLLLPFIVGQVAQPWFGDWVRANRRFTNLWDKGTILAVVLVSVVSATDAGVWETVSGWMIVWVGVISVVLVFIVLGATWWGGKLLGLNRGDKIALLMCGSKKSMATGLPMANVLFSPAVVGPIVVPLIIFHQLQLMICAWIAQRMGARPEGVGAST
ncbi:MAG TPA: bile acid:sodium symporter family protein [Beutenbergiaceae bacterium]|nr:bile acid:sodium symporter family protein [Beutenbergiaceae bacterium]